MELLRQVCIKIVLPVERGEGRHFDGPASMPVGLLIVVYVTLLFLRYLLHYYTASTPTRSDQIEVFPHVRTTSLPGWLHNYPKYRQINSNSNNNTHTTTTHK